MRWKLLYHNRVNTGLILGFDRDNGKCMESTI